MAQPTLIPNGDGARLKSLPLDMPRNRCILALDLGTTIGWATPAERAALEALCVPVREQGCQAGAAASPMVHHRGAS